MGKIAYHMRVDLVKVSHKVPPTSRSRQEATIDEHGEGAMIDAQDTAVAMATGEDKQRSNTFIANLVKPRAVIRLTAFKEQQIAPHFLVAQFSLDRIGVTLCQDCVEMIHETRNVVRTVGRGLRVEKKYKRVTTTQATLFARRNMFNFRPRKE